MNISSHVSAGRICRAVTLGLSSLLFASSAHAEYELEAGHAYGDVETARMTALSGAVHSTSNSLTALFVNPANLAIAQLYHVGGLGQLYPEAGRQTVGAAIVDSILSSSGLAGGLSFSYNQQDPGGLGRQWMDLRFGLALPIPDILFIGATGRYVKLAQSGVGPLGFSEASGGLDGSVMVETVTVDVGATLRPIPEFVVSLVGHNLTNLDSSLLPLMAVLSVGFLTRKYSGAMDAVLETSTFDGPRVRLQTGAEALVAEHLALRTGYRFDQGLDSHSASLGVGYVEPKFSIDLGGRRSITGPETTVITLGFTVHMEALGLGPSSTSD